MNAGPENAIRRRKNPVLEVISTLEFNSDNDLPIEELRTIYLKRKYDRYQELLLERVRVDDLFDHVSFRKSKNYWYFRLPSKYGRDYTGGFLTEELAITAYKEKLDSFKNV